MVDGRLLHAFEALGKMAEPAREQGKHQLAMNVYRLTESHWALAPIPKGQGRTHEFPGLMCGQRWRPRPLKFPTRLPIPTLNVDGLPGA
jgi:hypothetical protein